MHCTGLTKLNISFSLIYCKLRISVVDNKKLNFRLSSLLLKGVRYLSNFEEHFRKDYSKGREIIALTENIPV